MKKKKFFIFLFLFLFFVYELFPYSLFKTAALNKMEDFLKESGTPFSLNATSILPYWLTGIEVKDLEVSNSSSITGVPLKIERLTARLSILPLFIGRLQANVQLTQGNGKFYISGSIPILSLLKNKPALQSGEVEFSKFSINEVFQQYLNVLRSSQNPSVSLILPLLTDMQLNGELNGNVETGDNQQGKLNLTFQGLSINFNNPALNIPKQNFSTAKLNIEWKNGVFELKENKLSSEDLLLDVKGRLRETDFNKPMQADLKLNLVLKGEIENNYGFLVPQLLKCPPPAKAGELRVSLIGPIGKLTCQAN